MKRLLLILSIGLALPGVAKAGTVVTPNVTMVSRDVPIGARALQAATAPMRFDMLGLHWQGAGSVAYRTRSPAGRWSAWTTADADLPQTKPPWHFGNLDWTGEADAVQFRPDGITHLRAYYLSSRVTSAPKRSLSQRVGPWREALSLNSNRTIYEGDRSRRGAVLSSLVVRSRSTGRGDQSRIRCLK